MVRDIIHSLRSSSGEFTDLELARLDVLALYCEEMRREYKLHRYLPLDELLFGLRTSFAVELFGLDTYSVYARLDALS